MKNITFLFALLITAIVANAQKFTYLGINYTVTSATTVEVGDNQNFQNSTGKFEIPTTVPYNNANYTVTGISENAFSDNTYMVGISIPSSVAYIKSNAFGGCIYLYDIFLEWNSPLSIESNVFGNLKQLKTLLRESLITLHVPLEALTAYKSASVWSDWIVTSSFTVDGINYNLLSPNTVEIGKNRFYSGSANIQSTVTYKGLNYSVVSVGDFAFTSAYLSSISLPNSITSIGVAAFQSCGLGKIEIPNSVVTIKTYAFRDNFGLSSITLGTSIATIENEAFGYCGNLQTVIVTQITPLPINENIFGTSELAVNNVDLSKVTLKTPFGTSQAYKQADVWKKFFIPEAEQSTIYNGIQYFFTSPTTVAMGRRVDPQIGEGVRGSIPYNGSTYTVTSIRDSAFAGYTDNQVREIFIPSAVKSIGNYAFSGCTSLLAVHLNDSLESIGNSAFYSCENMLTAEIKSTSLLKKIGISAFESCRSLRDFNLPSGVTSIGSGAFKGCSNLPTQEIPSGLTTLEDYVFAACQSFTSIKIPNSVKSIGKNAFYGCYGLTTIDIPNSVTTIGVQAFNSCTFVKSLTLPSSIVNIQYGAFANFYSLQTLKVNWQTPIAITADVFTGTTISTVTLTIPTFTTDNYKTMPVWSNFKIVSNDITFGINGINYKATSPTTIKVDTTTTFAGLADIPGTIEFNAVNYTVNEIGVGAFANCFKLTGVTIPSTVTTIGNSAFHSCNGLTSFNIPNSVINLGVNVLYNCLNIKEIIVDWDKPLIINPNQSAFGNLSISTVKLKVPPFKNSIYANEVVWKDFIIESELSTQIAGIKFAFTSDKTVNVTRNPLASGEINIPNKVNYNGRVYNVMNIEDDAFMNCSSITKVNFKMLTLSNARLATIDTSFIATIGKSAFKGCTSLTSLDIPSSVTSIGDSAFANCTGLEEVIVNWETPLDINENVFDGVQISGVALTVPFDTEQDYKSAPVWKNFAIVTGLETLKNLELIVYPNPVSGNNEVKLSSMVSAYTLLNGNGLEVASGSNTDKVTISGLAKGLYVLKADNQSIKLIIE